MSRVKQTFGEHASGSPVVTVRGPHNRSSDKWHLDMVHSALALYWQGNPERAQREIAALRQALDFIAEQLGLDRGDGTA